MPAALIVSITNLINMHVLLFSLARAHRAMSFGNLHAGAAWLLGRRRADPLGVGADPPGLGAHPPGKRCDVSLTKPRDDFGRVD